MKHLKFCAALGLFLTFIGSAGHINAEGTVWCGWDNKIELCLAGGHDGYCAYGGPDCMTTIIVVTP